MCELSPKELAFEDVAMCIVSCDHNTREVGVDVQFRINGGTTLHRPQADFIFTDKERPSTF